MIAYRNIYTSELTLALFEDFTRTQVVTKCLRKIDGQWVARDVPFIDDWSGSEYSFLIECLKNTIATGGLVLGAFSDGVLKGFVSVESGLFGGENKYMDMTSLHVSQDLRHTGIGRELFTKAKEFAKAQGAKKLYISAHSAVETQAFYKAMGCVEAAEYSAAHVEKEPCDCQMECAV